MPCPCELIQSRSGIFVSIPHAWRRGVFSVCGDNNKVLEIRLESPALYKGMYILLSVLTILFEEITILTGGVYLF